MKNLYLERLLVLKLITELKWNSLKMMDQIVDTLYHTRKYLIPASALQFIRR